MWCDYVILFTYDDEFNYLYINKYTKYIHLNTKRSGLKYVADILLNYANNLMSIFQCQVFLIIMDLSALIVNTCASSCLLITASFLFLWLCKGAPMVDVLLIPSDLTALS